MYIVGVTEFRKLYSKSGLHILGREFEGNDGKILRNRHNIDMVMIKVREVSV